MKKRLKRLLGKVADHTLAAVVGLIVALGAGLVIGNPGEVVRSSSLAGTATKRPREAVVPSRANRPEDAATPEAMLPQGGTSEKVEPSRRTNPRTQTKPSAEVASRVDGWPVGVSAWTVILASERTRAAARAAVERAGEAPVGGLSLGVLHSNDYASLRSGYWVAFAGQFSHSGEALEAAEHFQSEFPTAYPRFVEE